MFSHYVAYVTLIRRCGHERGTPYNLEPHLPLRDNGYVGRKTARSQM